ncbi:stabilizer of axonemal microtubules 2 [Biomphalaria glabrata]|nr:stabilizer of axonemal microtubules 2 [Biomphalaria glabrata]
MPMKREATSDSLLANGPRSEYVKRYQEYPLQRTKSIRPSNELIKGQGEVESVTVFRRDFPEHPLAKRERPVPREGNLRPEGQHDFTSSYQNEYPGKLSMISAWLDLPWQLKCIANSMG